MTDRREPYDTDLDGVLQGHIRTTVPMCPACCFAIQVVTRQPRSRSCDNCGCEFDVFGETRARGVLYTCTRRIPGKDRSFT